MPTILWIFWVIAGCHVTITTCNITVKGGDHKNPIIDFFIGLLISAFLSVIYLVCLYGGWHIFTYFVSLARG